MATAPSKFRLFRHIERGLYDATGLINLDNLRKELGLTVEQMAQAVGKNLRTLQKNPRSRPIQERLTRIVAVLTLLHELAENAEEAQLWLNAPNPDYAGLTPKQLIIQGKAQALIDYLNEVRTGALR